MATTVTRCVLVAAALVAVAWLALSIRAIDLEAKGRAIFERQQRGPISLAEVRRGQSYLERARRFNADDSPLLYESFLLFDRGRFDEAAATAERLVADEPENLDGWIVLYLAARGPEGGSRERDPARAAKALRRVDELNPWAADALR